MAEDVHQARVAARRLRSNLKTFGRLLDPVWVKHVRSDLKWLSSALGELRDADVLAENLREAPPQLLRELADERARAARHLRPYWVRSSTSTCWTDSMSPHGHLRLPLGAATTARR